jgi:hypothetical protein
MQTMQSDVDVGGAFVRQQAHGKEKLIKGRSPGESAGGRNRKSYVLFPEGSRTVARFFDILTQRLVVDHRTERGRCLRTATMGKGRTEG